ncbi:hypothetical protein TNCV_4003021 [Trichonephila clavipes]|nr:hypothetical protein TNCV_4003021 [Trichonephila clavipes]
MRTGAYHRAQTSVFLIWLFDILCPQLVMTETGYLQRTGGSMSTQTIRKSLHEVQLRTWAPAKRVLFTVQHMDRQRRVIFV